MPLLDETSEVWSPVGAQHLGGSRYRVVGRPPSDERWRFSTGAIVICEERMLGGAKSLIALNLAA
jgi:hypothetical protein